MAGLSDRGFCEGRALVGLCLLALLGVAQRGQAGTPGLEAEVTAFLQDHYRAFELSEYDAEAALRRVAAGVSEDYSSIFIMGGGREVRRFGGESERSGMRKAFELYHGRRPLMRISKVVVLPRSADEVVALFKMDFHLEGVWRNDALSIAELRRENGRWKMRRLYENKRK